MCIPDLWKTGTGIDPKCRQGIFYAILIFILHALFEYTGVIYAQAASDIFTAIVAYLLLKNTLLKELNA